MLDAPEQALHERGPLHRSGLVHHSDRGSQYFSVLDTECLAQAVIEASVGSAGDGYDNALATSINGFCKAEVKHQGGPGIRHPRVGGSVQPSAVGKADRQYPARRSQSTTLRRRPGEPATGSVTQTSQPPAKPGRSHPPH